MATKQVIEIDVTWDTYGKKLSLNGLLQWISAADMQIKRLTIKEKK